MKADFFKRIFAYMIDYFIILLVLSFITANINVGSDITEKVNNLTNEYKNGNITIEEYNEEALPLNYELTKRKLPVNVITCVIIIGYYIVFAYFNNGQTLGKKICKIRVVNDKGERASIWNILIRSLFIYGIITTLYSLISINFLDIESFNYSVSVISVIESLFIVISLLMMLYKKDGRGLHDIIAKTRVIGEDDKKWKELIKN
ncbi:MAG: RDD family protein [Bacilli bacterium]